jgi:predicted nucleotidyltransferase
MRKRSSSTVRVYFPELSRDELIVRLGRAAERLSKLLDLKKVVLFGSWARGKYTAFSDVDVLIVYGGRKVGDNYLVCSRIFRVPRIELFVYAEDEYVKLRSSGSSICREVERHGIEVWPRPPTLK